MSKLTMMGILSLGFASCLANKYCSIPGFANPGNLVMKINARESPSFLLEFYDFRPPLLNATVLTLFCLSDASGLGNW